MTGFAVLAIALIALWANWQYVEPYLTNRVGAPSQTYPATTINPDQTPVVRLAVAGDVGTGGEAARRTGEVMDDLDEAYPFDALLLLGDNVYDNGDPSQIQAKTLDPFADVLDNGTELIPVLGNHDIRDGNGPAHAEALGMPGFWYAKTVGNTQVIALDSNQPANADQLAWLESSLAGPRSTWTIVIMHHPAFSGGWHEGDPGVQEHFVPLFEAYGVDLVLSGHEHDYQRITETNGVTYVVTGAAAKLRRTGRASFTEVAASTHSFVDLAVHADRIVAQAIDHDGRSFDSFTIDLG